MEETVLDLEQWELKQSALLKAMKDVEDRVDSTGTSFRTREKVLVAIEWSLNKLQEFEQGKTHLPSLKLMIEEKTQELCRIENLIREMGLKLKGFNLCKKSMEDWWCKVELKERELEGLFEKLKSNEVLFEPNVKELEFVAGKVKECMNVAEMKVALKFGELKLAAEMVNECDGEVRLREKEMEQRANELVFREKQVELGIEEVNVKDKRVNELLNEVQLKKIQFYSLQKSVEKREKHLDSLQRTVEERGKCLDSLEKSVELHEKHLDSLQKSVVVRKKHVELVRKRVKLRKKGMDSRQKTAKEHERCLVSLQKSVEEREKHLDSLQKTVKECERDLDSRKKTAKEHEMHLDSLQKSLEEREKNVESVHKTVEERERDSYLRQKTAKEHEMHLDSLQKSVEDREKTLDSLSHELLRKERDLVQQAKELELKQKKFDSQVPSYSSYQSCINMDGRTLQSLFNDQFKRHVIAGSQMSAVRHASADPAKLVLDAMKGFYPSNLTVNNRDVEFELQVVGKTCSLLLKELKRMAPQINHHVREEARTFAADWKAKRTLATENNLEALCFLQLIAMYELTGICGARELQSLLTMIAHLEQETNSMPSLVQKNEAESSLAGNAATFLSPSKPNATRTKLGIVDENSSGDRPLQKESAVSLPLVPDPAKMVLNNMQKCLAQYLIYGNFEEGVTCSDISLLKELVSVSLPVGSHLKADATTLAAQWKAKMGGNTVNPLESVGFLLFVATCGLVCMLSIDEIVQLLGSVSQSKLALELCQTDGFAAQIADIVCDLMERKQLTEAVRFIFTFKLTDKLPPVPLLKEVEKKRLRLL